MANLREIKSKIKSVKNLKKITRALEVVSTVKLQKTKQQADALKGYLVDLLAILSQVGEKIDVFGHRGDTKKTSGDKKKLVIVLTSERGLCGALNAKLLRKLYKDLGLGKKDGEKELEEKELEEKEADYFVVGKKGLEYLKRAKANIVGSLHVADTFTEEELLPLYSYFDQAVAGDTYDEVVLYFNYFKNSILQIPSAIQLVPFSKETFDSFVADLELEYSIENNIASKDMIIEPSVEEYVVEMRRQIRNYVLNAALIQNKTGEHAARMIAMKSAKDNATEFTKSLTLSFNKARQGAITQEISEIVSAKIAIGG